MESIENNLEVKKEEVKSVELISNQPDTEKEIKKQMRKGIILFAILIISISVYAFINYRYEREFKREFELPGQSL